MHNPTAADDGAEQRATSAAAGARARAESKASRYDMHARDDSPDEFMKERRETRSRIRELTNGLPTCVKPPLSELRPAHDG